MRNGKAIIRHPLGLHARPAAEWVSKALQFESDIQIALNGKTANGKSAIHLLTLGVKEGDIVDITASGPDEEQVVSAFLQFAESLS
ncbi:HPr family phosphocarrier protein [Paenibacillus thalictri]|uniref:Phosphocarrier protein HPr n=1 Tax=Paenibacillus thalictri TaxID=2527873 RepID=A0A4Q9DXC3_9BACL|nr:HPr family phosphocarrier protein [Paenibacillus thalictri]TBL81767.1 HPr family phosphocarrier protein [Paenibacillus thalictri]